MQPGDVNAALRRLPKVDEVLQRPDVAGLLEHAPRWAVLQAVRGEIERLRAQLLGGAQIEPALDAGKVARDVDSLLRPSLTPVRNATGVVLHTNLGRAPLAARALDRITEVSRGYANLEYNL